MRTDSSNSTEDEVVANVVIDAIVVKLLLHIDAHELPDTVGVIPWNSHEVGEAD